LSRIFVTSQKTRNCKSLFSRILKAGPVVAAFRVASVEYVDRNEGKRARLCRDRNDVIGADEEFWQTREDKRSENRDIDAKAAAILRNAVAIRLERLDYCKVRKYREGIQDWVRAGLPAQRVTVDRHACPNPS